MAEFDTDKDAKRKMALKRTLANLSMEHHDMAPLIPDILHTFYSQHVEIHALARLVLSMIPFRETTTLESRKASPKIELTPGVMAYFQRMLRDRHGYQRAVALRWMSYIRAEQCMGLVKGPLIASLQDEDPYVRKTACIGILKWILNQGETGKRADVNGMLSAVMQVLSDASPVVCVLFDVEYFTNIVILGTGKCGGRVDRDIGILFRVSIGGVDFCGKETRCRDSRVFRV